MQKEHFVCRDGGNLLHGAAQTREVSSGEALPRVPEGGRDVLRLQGGRDVPRLQGDGGDVQQGAGGDLH